MKALVTGATGFIGSVLVRALLRQGHEVRALVLPGEDAGPLEKLGVEIRRGDLSRAVTLSGICDGTETVFHQAGRVTDWGTRSQFKAAICDATQNLLQESAGSAERFVFVSSIAAIGLGRHLKGIRESDPVLRSGIPYGDAKLDAEELVRGFDEAGGIACTIVRPSNVTGPGSVWVRDIVEKMLAMPMLLVDEGRHSASLVHVDNLVDGILRAGTLEIGRGRTYHFRDDWDVTWKQYVTDVGAFVGKEPTGNIPYELARIAGGLLDLVCAPFGIRPPLSRLAVDIVGRDNDVDTSLARQELGWKTRVTYDEAMREIGDWVGKMYLKDAGASPGGRTSPRRRAP